MGIPVHHTSCSTHIESFLMQEIYVGYDCRLFVNRFYAKNSMMILITKTISLWNFNGLFISVRPVPSESSGFHVTPCLVCLLDPTQYGTLKTNLSAHMPLMDMWTWTHSYTQSLTLAIEVTGQHHAPASLLPGKNSLLPTNRRLGVPQPVWIQTREKCHVPTAKWTTIPSHHINYVTVAPLSMPQYTALTTPSAIPLLWNHIWCNE